MPKSARPQTGVGRRHVLKAAGAGVLALVAGGLSARPAGATPESAAALMKKLTGGAAAKIGGITLKMPEIAEDGRTVPLTVRVDSPMTEADHVTAIHIVAEGNPNPEVLTVRLGPANGKAEVSTRMRVGKTQTVIASAVMSDGSVSTVRRTVTVTIGGCGG